MALQRATFSITCDTNGRGSTDVSFKLPSELSRPARLVAVSLDSTTLAPGAAGATITLSELLDVSAATWNGTSETVALDRQLVHIDLSKVANVDGPQDVWHPRAGTVDRFGTPGSATDGSQDGYVLIRSKKVRGEVFGAASGDVFTVYAHYETAGDYRF